MHDHRKRATRVSHLLLVATLLAVVALPVPAEPPIHPPLVEVTRVVSDADGTTRFASGAVPLALADYAPPAPPVAISPHLDATDLAFVSLAPGYFGDWHPAPRRQYGLLLGGTLEIETGDGARKRFGSGSVFLLEDVSGRGHRTTVVGDAPALIALVPVPAGQ
ncbi:MAG: cupin domain-containing protein [Gammaproteobacteria bacterium]